MPPSAKKHPRSPIIRSSSDDSDSEEERRPRKSNKNAKNTKSRPPIQEPDFDEDMDDEEEVDFYDEDNRVYYNLANEVVNKNVKLQSLFDPKVLPGFYALINHTSKISSASRVLEASFRIYGKRVDVVHNEVRKLDHDVGVRVIDEKATKMKTETDVQDPLNTSLSEWDAPQNGGDPGFFSEDDEVTITQKKKKHKEPETMNIVDMTTFVNFEFDEGNSADIPSTSMGTNADGSFRFDNDKLGIKIVEISNDRTVLMGSKIRSLNEIEIRLKRANAAAMEYFRKEGLKRGMQKGSKKGTSLEPEVSNDYSTFHVPFFQYTMEKKREKTHVCIDDVAAAKPDYSRIYIHNEWDEDDEVLDVQVEGDFMDPFNHCNDNEIDSIDCILEQFQGALELATMTNQKLETEWVDLIGLDKKDLKGSRETDVSFEQTANDDFDPDKRLVDRISIPGEDEIMEKEVIRVNSLVKQLFIGRVTLPGGAGNSNENSIRRQLNKPVFCPMFHDEDIFFPFDLTKHITEDSISAQVAIARSYFINHFSLDEALIFGIPEKLFKVLLTFSLSSSTLPDEILNIVDNIPNHFFTKCLLTDAKTALSFVQESQYLSTILIPFRMARFAQQLMNSVIHEVSSNQIKIELIHRNTPSRPQSSMISISPSKRSRIDESIKGGDTVRYFAAKQIPLKARYSKQVLNNDAKSIVDICNKAILEDRGSKAFLSGRIGEYKIEAIYAILNILKLFNEFKSKDLASLPTVKDLPKIDEINNDQELADDEQIKAQNELIDNLNVIEADENRMEIDNNFDFDDNDADFVNSLSSPRPLGDHINPEVSQDILANMQDKDNGACDDNDDIFNSQFFVDPQQQLSLSIGFDDSLAKLVNDHTSPEPPSESRPKRKIKRIEFLEDDAHWVKPGEGLKTVRKRQPFNNEKENTDDNLLFVPRDTFAKVNTSRHRTRSKSSAVSLAETERIERCQDVSYPIKIREPFAYRLDDQLALCIPGNSDPDKIFVAIPFPEIVKRHLSSYAVLYRGEHCHLHPTLPARQDSDFQFWLNVHRICENIRQERKNESATKINEIATNGCDGHANDYSDDDYVDADNGFNPHTPPPPIHPLSQVEKNNWHDVVGEYNYRDSDEEDEVDDFDFVSKVDKSSAIEYGEGALYLKSAIKFILTRKEYEKPNIAAIGKGQLNISNGVSKSQYHVASTIATDTTSNKNNASVMEVDDGEDEHENDTDEKTVKNFKVNGFHTLKSILYYLPEVCHRDTIRILSTAHVFCTLCHMANENSLCLKQQESDNGDVDEISDCQIINIVETVDANME